MSNEILKSDSSKKLSSGQAQSATRLDVEQLSEESLRKLLRKQLDQVTEIKVIYELGQRAQHEDH